MTDLNVTQLNRLENSLTGKSLKPNISGENLLNSSAYSGREDGLPKAEGAQKKSSEMIPLSDSEDVSKQNVNAINSDNVEQVLENLNEQLAVLQNYLSFEKNEDSERMVIFIKNRETDELIRQIPSQEFLAISKNITKFLEMRQQLFEDVAIPTGLITNVKA